MWYSKGTMRSLFFLGAAMALIGLGLVMMEHTLPGALILCLGVAAAVIGFMGLRLNTMVEWEKMKRERRSGGSR